MSTTSDDDNVHKYRQWFNCLKQLDMKFWSGNASVITAREQYELHTHAMNFYGEIFMCCALKIKTCVMFSEIFDKKLMERYRRQVLEACNSFDLFPSLQFRPILNNFETANDNKYQGLHVLYLNEPRTTLIDQMEQVMLETKATTASNSIVSEQFMSLLFDYPVPLPEGQEMLALMNGQCDYCMCEVAYKDISDPNNHIIVSTFGVRKTRTDLQLLKQHFLHCQKVCAPYFPLDMELVVLSD